MEPWGKELSNGRLAMIGIAAAAVQERESGRELSDLLAQ